MVEQYYFQGVVDFFRGGKSHCWAWSYTIHFRKVGLCKRCKEASLGVVGESNDLRGRKRLELGGYFTSPFGIIVSLLLIMQGRDSAVLRKVQECVGQGFNQASFTRSKAASGTIH
jgi:hypothetical protein